MFFSVALAIGEQTGVRRAHGRAERAAEAVAKVGKLSSDL